MSTYVSLFSGIGGGCVALEAFGYEPAAQVEWNDHCRAHLARHWPDVPRWGDVHDFAGTEFLRAGRDRPEILFGGGFPCQPVSVAGRRKAQDDDRWLWPEVARIADELRPRVIVLENVRGLLSAGDPFGSAFAEVVGTLADLGFDSRWGVVRASDAGACHQRARLFIVADTADPGHERSRGPWDRRTRPANCGDVAAHADGQQLRLEPRGGCWPCGEGSVLAGLDGATGSPADADGEGFRPSFQSLAVGSHERAARPADSTAWGQYEPAVRQWERVMGPAPAPVETGRLSADFVEWMMGFPTGWVEGGRSDRIKALGNSVVPHQAVYAFAQLGLRPAPSIRSDWVGERMQAVYA